MLFAVRFHDHPDRVDVRGRFLQAHIDWLELHRGEILVGGSLRDSPEHTPVGGLWIVETPSAARVRALIETDPFWIEGLRERVEIHHWSKAFPDRQVLV